MKNPPKTGGFLLHFKVERATGLEPATATLARWYSTIELRARWKGSRPNPLATVKPLGKTITDNLRGRVEPLSLQKSCSFIRK